MADDAIERLLAEVAAGSQPKAEGSATNSDSALARRAAGTDVTSDKPGGGMGTTGRVLVSGGAGAAVSLLTYAIPVVGWMDTTANLLAGFLGGVTGFAVAGYFRRRDRKR